MSKNQHEQAEKQEKSGSLVHFQTIPLLCKDDPAWLFPLLRFVKFGRAKYEDDIDDEEFAEVTKSLDWTAELQYLSGKTWEMQCMVCALYVMPATFGSKNEVPIACAKCRKVPASYCPRTFCTYRPILSRLCCGMCSLHEIKNNISKQLVQDLDELPDDYPRTS